MCNAISFICNPKQTKVFGKKKKEKRLLGYRNWGLMEKSTKDILE
jgi:hypothetical protein